MITLADFKKYEDLERQLKEFLISRLNDYNDAKAYRTEDYYIDGIDIEYLDSFEIRDSKMILYFYNSERDFGDYTHELPLEHLFNPDFKQLMKARSDEERRKEGLRIIEFQKQHVEKLKAKAEKKRFEEMELMRKLIKKYPEELFVSLVYQSPIHKVFKAFPEHGEFDISDIAGTALVSPSYVKSVLSSTIRDKFVKDLGNGKYTLTPEGIQMFKSKNI